MKTLIWPAFRRETEAMTINRLIGEKADLEVKVLRAQELLQEVVDDPLLASWNQNFIAKINRELK